MFSVFYLLRPALYLFLQYETRVYRRFITLQNMTGQTGDVFFSYILKESPPGVSLRVDKVGQTARSNPTSFDPPLMSFSCMMSFAVLEQPHTPQFNSGRKVFFQRQKFFNSPSQQSTAQWRRQHCPTLPLHLNQLLPCPAMPTPRKRSRHSEEPRT